MRAGTLIVDDSTISADNGGEGPGGIIALSGEGELTITNGSHINAFAGYNFTGYGFNGGSAASIRLWGGDVTVEMGGAVSSVALGRGDSGDITVDADGALAVVGGGSAFSAISTDSYGSGKAGHIIINAESVTLGNLGYVSSLSGCTLTCGDAGDITISANSVTLEDWGFIRTTTWSLGSGGNVSINVAGPLAISDPYSGIYASSGDVGAPHALVGNAGDVSVTAESITIVDGGRIDSTTRSDGNGGNIVVRTLGALEIAWRSK